MTYGVYVPCRRINRYRPCKVRSPLAIDERYSGARIRVGRASHHASSLRTLGRFLAFSFCISITCSSNWGARWVHVRCDGMIMSRICSDWMLRVRGSTGVTGVQRWLELRAWSYSDTNSHTDSTQEERQAVPSDDTYLFLLFFQEDNHIQPGVNVRS